MTEEYKTYLLEKLASAKERIQERIDKLESRLHLTDASVLEKLDILRTLDVMTDGLTVILVSSKADES